MKKEVTANTREIKKESLGIVANFYMPTNASI